MGSVPLVLLRLAELGFESTGLIPEPTLSCLCALVSSCLLEVLSPLFPLILQSPKESLPLVSS